MQKKIYQIGIKQNLLYTQPLSDYIIDYVISFFKKQKHHRIHTSWIIVNVKDIYATSYEEALEKYIKYYPHEAKLSNKKWYTWSDNISWFFDVTSDCFKLINEKYVLLNDNYYPSNINEVKNSLSAYDFREWWNDYHHNDDIGEVIKND